MAVIFFIHGGGFAEGSGNDYFYGPDSLIEQGVILVTINYRLGIFGFLSLNTNKYSGNMGLKDQYLALKWTHHNIESFGGDKRRITVMGQSAGTTNCFFLSLINYFARNFTFNQIFNRRCCISSLSPSYTQITETYSTRHLLKWVRIFTLFIFRYQQPFG